MGGRARIFLLAGLAAGALAAPTAAQAARTTIGSSLAQPATAAFGSANDTAYWPATALDVPVAGQAIILRVKGGTHRRTTRSTTSSTSRSCGRPAGRGRSSRRPTTTGCR